MSAYIGCSKNRGVSRGRGDSSLLPPRVAQLVGGRADERRERRGLVLEQPLVEGGYRELFLERLVLGFGVTV